MRKILMRSAMPFGGNNNASEILIYNMVGNNTGNLLFQNSVARVIMTEDTQITTVNTNRKFSDAEVEYFNSEYDMFLIPLANALRVSFSEQLESLTSLIKRLTIPCVVVGMGLQKNLDSEKWTFPFDELADDFLKAVLEKSSIIGIRGEITGEYLRRRGLIPEKDFTVIGCPSMYSYGDNLPVPRVKELTPESKVSMNFKAELKPELYEFIRKEASKFKDSTFITQVIKEIKNLYVGYPYPLKKGKAIPEDYPIHFTSELMLHDRMVGFLDEPSWIGYLKTRDFNFGSRIHGDIASILAGTPCVIFAGDCRVKELSEYHHIPHMSMMDIDSETNIFDVYQKADYDYLLKGHEERLTHYLDFLDKNDVERVDRAVLNSGDTPFDRLLTSWNTVGVIHSFPSCSLEEQERRIQEYIGTQEQKEKNAQEKNRDYRKKSREKLKESQKHCKELEKELAEIKASRFYKLKLRYDSVKKKFG